MKRTIIFLLIFTVLPLGIIAQKDAKAKDILDKSAATYQSAGGVFASFTLNVKNVKQKISESFEGSILMKSNKFYLSTPDTETWFDGKTQWTYMKSSDEVNISEPSDEELQMINPVAIFSIYQKGFNYKYTGEKKDIKGNAVSEIELTPQTKKSDISKIIIQIGKSSNLPTSISIINKSQINNNIYINRYQTNMLLIDEVFVFNKKNYPKAEVIDLR